MLPLAMRQRTPGSFSRIRRRASHPFIRGNPRSITTRAIRDALAAGCDVYNLRGITPTLDTDDPHVGLIRFKVGTGGHAVQYVGEWDLPLRPAIYRGFGRYLRWRRR